MLMNARAVGTMQHKKLTGITAGHAQNAAYAVEG